MLKDFSMIARKRMLFR